MSLSHSDKKALESLLADIRLARSELQKQTKGITHMSSTSPTPPAESPLVSQVIAEFAQYKADVATAITNAMNNPATTLDPADATALQGLLSSEQEADASLTQAPAPSDPPAAS